MCNGLSIIEIIEIYDVAVKQAILIKFIIATVSGYMIIGIYILEYLIETYCPNVYARLKNWNIV